MRDKKLIEVKWEVVEQTERIEHEAQDDNHQDVI